MAGFTFRACAVRGGSILQGLLSIEGMTGIDLPVITLIEKREDAHLLAKCLLPLLLPSLLLLICLLVLSSMLLLLLPLLLPFTLRAARTASGASEDNSVLEPVTPAAATAATHVAAIKVATSRWCLLSPRGCRQYRYC